ncbi:hypothetical protein SDC9_82968 [bioreactor metagenome]|uniref:Uncharacterized protein n=1 Tax=bioreactor metagenome TaxID=1076179 RepID=A0A644Z6D1_9ZZZZ
MRSTSAEAISSCSTFWEKRLSRVSEILVSYICRASSIAEVIVLSLSNNVLYGNDLESSEYTDGSFGNLVLAETNTVTVTPNASLITAFRVSRAENIAASVSGASTTSKQFSSSSYSANTTGSADRTLNAVLQMACLSMVRSFTLSYRTITLEQYSLMERTTK